MKTLSLIFFCCMTTNMAFAKPVEIQLKKQKMATEQMSQLCKLLANDCLETTNWQWFKAQQNYYLIDQLKLYQFSGNIDNTLKIQKQWDFSAYQAKTQQPRWSEMSDEPSPLTIFPKLFPVNEHDYAVALVQRWNESYSGGGMHEEVADFVQLLPNGKYQQIFQNIPLSMYRMIRACFSEEDYKKAGEQCHDEYALATEIAYVKPRTWNVKYHYQSWISKVSDSNEKNIDERKNYVLNQNSADAIQLPKRW